MDALDLARVMFGFMTEPQRMPPYVVYGAKVDEGRDSTERECLIHARTRGSECSGPVRRRLACDDARAGALTCAGDSDGFPDHLRGITPLVIVPAQHLDEVSVHHLGQLQIHDRRT